MCVVEIEIRLKYNLSKYFFVSSKYLFQYLFKYFRNHFLVPSEYLFHAVRVQIFEQTCFCHHHQHRSCEEGDGDCNDSRHHDLIMTDDCEDDSLLKQILRLVLARGLVNSNLSDACRYHHLNVIILIVCIKKPSHCKINGGNHW